jgi:methylation protein EvaC
MNKKCLFCQSPVEQFMTFGQQPIANGFLTPQQYDREYFFEMACAFCEKCGCFQLLDQPEPEQMFNENYAFFSGTSKHMAIHFQEFAQHVQRDYLKNSDPFVVEIGSNDGILLRNFATKGIRHVGVEPSKNVAEAAMKNGVNTINSFFNAETAHRIVKENGKADAFLAANCMCHIPYLHSVVEGIDVLLKQDGVVLFEDPYLGDVIQKTSYDQIYDEHTFIFSVQSINYLFGQYGMEVFDVEPQSTHGGSMRYVVGRKGIRPLSPALKKQVEFEKQLGLHKKETYEKFRQNCEVSKAQLKELLTNLKKQGKRVVGYAATSKSTTILNYCGIGPDLIEFICDTTPIKQGKYSPGRHIPIVAHEDFKKSYPDYAFLFAWNHFKEVMEKEEAFKEKGGKWILHVPEVKVLS